jgi:predicted hydrocarbon binding protein
MHDCTKDGAISIGGVSEQLYGEGFVAAWHDILGRELGERAPAALYEIGWKGARWEVAKAIEVGVWVPRLLRPLVGRKDMLEKARSSKFHRALLEESLAILFRMIMTEGGWGVVEEIDLLSSPIRVVVANTPEPRRLGHTGRCSCHLMTGIYAGYFETLFGTPCHGWETTCRSGGDPVCTFELALGTEPEKAEAEPAAEPERVLEAAARPK